MQFRIFSQSKFLVAVQRTLLYAVFALISQGSEVIQAQNPTPTPIRVEIPTQKVLPTEIALDTPAPTWTPTAEGPVLLRLADSAESANMRLQPDPSGELLGQIEPNTTYVVTGRYFSWYQFVNDRSPTGRAWVFESLVTIIGDEADIPDADPFAAPTPDANIQNITATWVAFAATPGAFETATAESRVIIVPTFVNNEPDGSAGRLPTFTPPPELNSLSRPETGRIVVTATAVPDLVNDSVQAVLSGRIAPVIPISLLAGFGLLGLIVSILRR